MLLYIECSDGLESSQPLCSQPPLRTFLGAGSWALTGCRSGSLGSSPVVTPPYQRDHDQFECKDEQRGPEHRTHGRCDHLGFHVHRVPERQTPPVATLAREAVPY